MEDILNIQYSVDEQALMDYHKKVPDHLVTPATASKKGFTYQ